MCGRAYETYTDKELNARYIRGAPSAKEVEQLILKPEPVYNLWRSGTSNERGSFSILTTAANSFMSQIHDRMPVILGRSDEDGWLDPNVHEQDELQKLFKPCPSSWLTAVEVSPLVNSPRNNTEAVLEPASRVSEREMPLLFDR